MRVGREDLEMFRRTVGPAPAPIEPVLSPAEEASVIAKGDDGDPAVVARRARALAIVRRPAPPSGADAALIALLADARALPLENDRDRLSARSRLTEIGRMKDPPREVLEICRRRRIAPGDSERFADAFLPRRHDGNAFFESGAGGTGISGVGGPGGGGGD